MKRTKRLTLAEQAYEEIEIRIISGSLPAGQRLLAVELAEELDVSQTPVKEALAALQRDGLVESEARRASTVRRFSPKDLAEIYEGRIMLEMHAIQKIVREKLATPDFLAEMDRLCESLAQGLETDTPEGLAEAVLHDREFHELMVRQAGNALLAGWHRTAIRQFQTARNYSFETYPKDSTIAGHRAIVAALGQPDVAKASEVLRYHLEGARDEMLARATEILPPREQG